MAKLSEEDVAGLEAYSWMKRDSRARAAGHDFPGNPRLRQVGEGSVSTDYFVSSDGSVLQRKSTYRVVSLLSYPVVELQTELPEGSHDSD